MTNNMATAPNSTARELDENHVVMSSWVHKKSMKTHQWKKRWAVLRNCQLSYYKSSSEHKPSKVINKNDLLSFSRILDSHKYQFAIYTSKRLFHFKVDTSELCDQWNDALESVIHVDEDSDEEQPNFERSELSEEYVVEEGDLERRKRYNQWKKNYLMITNKNLYLCKSKSENPYKVISVDRLLDVIEVEKGKPWCLMLITPLKNFYFGAGSEQEMTKWLSAIKAVILRNRRSSEAEIAMSRKP